MFAQTIINVALQTHENDALFVQIIMNMILWDCWNVFVAELVLISPYFEHIFRYTNTNTNTHRHVLYMHVSLISFSFSIAWDILIRKQKENWFTNSVSQTRGRKRYPLVVRHSVVRWERRKRTQTKHIRQMNTSQTRRKSHLY